ncbi:MAG: phage holin family protein [Saprospiraceae bacterium]|nr:phage holin family protein [Saprospiraceae bacterium]
MNILLRILFQAVLVILAAYLLPGIFVNSFLSAIIAAVFLLIGNNIIKPILVVLTIPITILTLGLFLLIINGFIVLLVDAVVDGFYVDGMFWAVIFSLVMAIFNYIFIEELK